MTTQMTPQHPCYPVLTLLLSEMEELNRRYTDSFYAFVSAGLEYTMDHLKEDDELWELLDELSCAWAEMTPGPDDSDITSEQLTSAFNVEDARDAVKEAIGYEG